MEHHVFWPSQKEDAPVFIKDVGGSEEILKRGYLSGELKASRIQVVGVVLDADARPDERYKRVRDLCYGLFPDFPSELPPHGLILDNEDKKRLGVWIMPDNSSEGCLETFLRYLVPDQTLQVWQHAVASTQAAGAWGAPFREPHTPKAEMYCWLSWQDPPGYSPGRALTQKILDPHSPFAAPFVNWFLELYRLEPIILPA